MESITIFEKNKEILIELSSKNLHKISLETPMEFSEVETDRIIQMAWEDRTPFEAIEFQFGLKEKQVIEFMRTNSKLSSFKMWRKRMKSRQTKHLALKTLNAHRFKCSMQRDTGNKIAKR
jgi:uncharacterized protein (TIGR03643 family)